ncbi:MAG: hypothetical protein J0H67_08450 [Rhodospirillales bacterium]|nr:hypothetical protein [Rhodospirillales bacterium]MBN8907620.1 hypothetical protein [Rhodospirillales bacterium]
MRKQIASLSDAICLAMEGYLVSTTDGAIVARMRDRYLVRHRGSRLDLPVDGMTYDAFLEAVQVFLAEARVVTPVADAMSPSALASSSSIPTISGDNRVSDRL